MLEADQHLPPATTGSFWKPQRKAWAVLLSAFAIFCTLASATAFAGYRYVTAPRANIVTAVVVLPNALYLQRAGLLRTEILEADSALAVGDRLTTGESGPPGVIAGIGIGSARVGLWQKTAVLVEEDESAGARLRLEDGQALIELPQDARSLFITATALPQQVELLAPGRYRIRRLADNTPITAIAERSLGDGIEVVVERGRARMGEATIDAGSRLLTNGTLRPERNRWSLLRDGNFSSFTADEYRATFYPETESRRSTTWSVTRQAVAQGAMVQSGLFFLRRDCPADDVPEEDCRNAARFARLGGNEKDSTTGIAQEIGADVTAYKSVILEADVRVDYQSLSRGGADGTECPLFAQVVYANATRSGISQWFCFWAFDSGSGAISDLPYIASEQIPPKSWHHFRTDLRARIPDLRVIEQLIFYSNGHDYDASVADVSLRAEGIAAALQP
jgi:hypothetical protein